MATNLERNEEEKNIIKGLVAKINAGLIISKINVLSFENLSIAGINNAYDAVSKRLDKFQAYLENRSDLLLDKADMVTFMENNPTKVNDICALQKEMKAMFMEDHGIRDESKRLLALVKDLNWLEVLLDDDDDDDDDE